MKNKRCVRCGMKYPGHKLSCKIPIEEWRLPTAEEFFEDWCDEKGYVSIDQADNIEECMIEFAKLHCEAQLKAILENVKLEHDFLDDERYSNYCGEDSIINAYPLDKIQ